MNIINCDSESALNRIWNNEKDGVFDHSIPNNDSGGAGSCCWTTISSGDSSGTLTVVGCIDHMFSICWSKWPLCIATDCVGQWRTYTEVRPVHVAKRPASMISHHGDGMGEKSDV
jgi:hypothetical protein